jgi:hypothetical protein
MHILFSTFVSETLGFSLRCARREALSQDSDSSLVLTTATPLPSLFGLALHVALRIANLVHFWN